MKQRVRALLLTANGFGWRPILADSFLAGFLKISHPEQLPRCLRESPIAKRAFKRHYESLSYIYDWQEALCNNPGLDVTICNINNLMLYLKILNHLDDFDLIIALHSAAGDDLGILTKTARRLQERRGKLVVFFGNEYDLMSEKVALLTQASADFVCSQLPMQTAAWLYSNVNNTQILEMPHALNPALYSPGKPRRQIDLGFRGSKYPLFIGDQERQKILDYFSTRLNTDLFVDIAYKKMDREEWAGFLKNCHGILGAEAGTYYLDKQGVGISKAKEFLKKNPSASLEDILAVFRDYALCYKSGKAISSRHFEAIGTKTCQLLLEGSYNNILLPDEHYISIRKDLSNIEDALERFKDQKYRESIVERAYDFALSAHTYQHRVNYLLGKVL